MHTAHHQLKTVTVPVTKAIQRFSQIKKLNPIPTNGIIDKTLPAIGATYTEIKEKRNSIIILANVSIILSKQGQHEADDHTFAVYKDVTPKKLQKYLDSKVPYKKILTTPEGFISKVRRLLGEGMYKDYFLLVDECHKLITDSGFRKEIVLPMEDFFKFEAKAMISATALIPSDPRLKEQGFKVYKVEPDYEYQKEILVTKTYNTLERLLTLLKEKPSACYCIFFNSIQGIKSALEGIAKEYGQENVMHGYRIFCSRESADELRHENYEHAEIEVKTLAKYNFFTSSFYSGLDIYYQGSDVTVVIITDAGYASHSVVYPAVDVVQIYGRFRPYEIKDKHQQKLINWVESCTHIVRTNKNMPAMSRVDAELKITVTKLFHEYIRTFKLSAPLAITQQEIDKVLERVHPYHHLLNKDGSFNSYRMDNYLLVEEVKSYYQKFKSLVKAYEDSKRFHLTFERATGFNSSVDRLNYGKGKYSAQNYREVTDLLWEIEADPTYWPNQLMVQYLSQHFELIVNAYFTLGIEYLVKLKFQHNYIQRLMRIVEALEGKNKFAVIDEVQATFRTGEVYKASKIKEKLQEIFDLYGIPGKADGSEIERYFDVEPCQQNRQRAFRILRAKHTNAYERK